MRYCQNRGCRLVRLIIFYEIGLISHRLGKLLELGIGQNYEPIRIIELGPASQINI